MTFCSRASMAAHEQLAGTGVHGEAYVFLPAAKQLWRESEMNRAWATAEELHAVRHARRAGVVTRLYNPPAAAGEGRAAPILVYGRSPALAALGELLAAVGRGRPVDQTGRPRLAICTHGTRDRCCAKWGFAAYKAARKLYDGGRSPFEPVECSHLGGDRFAATGIFFPTGDMYAHLDHLDLLDLAATVAAGRIAADGYRGRVYEPHLTQVVRAGLARAGLVEDAAASITLGARTETTVEAAVGGRRFRVALTTAPVRFYGSCEDAKAGRISTARRTVFAGAERLDAARLA